MKGDPSTSMSLPVRPVAAACASSRPSRIQGGGHLVEQHHLCLHRERTSDIATGWRSPPDRRAG